MNAFQVVKDFERALAEYTGAPYAVTTTSCTMALLLAVAWHLRNKSHDSIQGGPATTVGLKWRRNTHEIEIPKCTYISVPMSIIHAGGRPTFREEDWHGAYQLGII